jgi:hypothetical protein
MPGWFDVAPQGSYKSSYIYASQSRSDRYAFTFLEKPDGLQGRIMFLSSHDAI